MIDKSGFRFLYTLVPNIKNHYEKDPFKIYLPTCPCLCKAHCPARRRNQPIKFSAGSAWKAMEAGII